MTKTNASQNKANKSFDPHLAWGRAEQNNTKINTMKTKTKHAENQVNKRASSIQTRPLQAVRVLSTLSERFNLGHSPLFESRICRPADHPHCWRTSSSGRSAPLDWSAPGTRLQSHLEDWEREQMGPSVLRRDDRDTSQWGIINGLHYNINATFVRPKQDNICKKVFGNALEAFIFKLDYWRDCCNLCPCSSASTRPSGTNGAAL